MAPLGQRYENRVRKNQSFSYFHWYYNWNQTVTYESSREVKMTLRDSNENVKKKNNRFRLTKQQLRTCIKLFCTFLCRQARLWRELPNFTFHRQREHATTNFSFHPQLCLTQIGPTCAEGYHLVDLRSSTLICGIILLKVRDCGWNPLMWLLNSETSFKRGISLLRGLHCPVLENAW